MGEEVHVRVHCILGPEYMYSAPNEKLPKLNFSVFGLYLFNQSYLEQGNYIFTFSKHFCVRNCGVNLISTHKQSLATCRQITSKTHFSIITPTRNVTVSSNLCCKYNIRSPIYTVDLAS